MNEISSRAPVLPPPSERYSVVGWAHKNLFSTWYNTLLTLLAVGLIFALVKPSLSWIFTQADWEVIQVNIRLLMVGQYPQDEIWRIWLCLYLLAANLGLTWGIWEHRHRWLGIVLLLIPTGLAFLPTVSAAVRPNFIAIAGVGLIGFAIGRWRGKSLSRMAINSWILYFPFVILIVRGLAITERFIPEVPSNLWGGLLLTFLLAIVGISFSFPFGVMLALGRRSSLPAIRWVSIGYIEVVRGVPLVTILFMASVMVPLFLSGGTPPDRVLRAMIGITLFSAAYLAENVRGGLQAIPSGQYEAAHALGLSGFHTMLLVILPQALRLVIPVLMGLFISLFKDTSLVATIGLLDLLGISRSILAQPQYVSFAQEVYLFIAMVYWIFCYIMSYVSQRLETAMGVGER